MKFYIIKSTADDEESPWITEFLDLENSRKGPAPKCSVCGKYTGSLTWLPPFQANLECWGEGFGDWVFGPGDNILVSTRFRDLFVSHKLNGLVGFEPVEIHNVVKHRRFAGDPPEYFRVSIVQGRAAIDIAASRLELEPPKICPNCRLGGITKRTHGLILDPNGWTGEDVFFARGLTGTLFSSERFKDFCDQNGIKNTVLVPSENYSFDHYIWENP